MHPILRLCARSFMLKYLERNRNSRVCLPQYGKVFRNVCIGIVMKRVGINEHNICHSRED